MAFEDKLGCAVLPGEIAERPHGADLVFDFRIDYRIEIVLIAMKDLGGFAGVNLNGVRRVQPVIVAIRTQNRIGYLENERVRHQFCRRARNRQYSSDPQRVLAIEFRLEIVSVFLKMLPEFAFNLIKQIMFGHIVNDGRTVLFQHVDENIR